MEQVKKLKQMHNQLRNVLPLIEKKKNRKMKVLRNTLHSEFHSDCELYIDEKLVGCSECYYGGTSQDVDFIVSVQLFEDELFFNYEKCYIICDDLKKKFKTIEELKTFLEKENIIDSCIIVKLVGEDDWGRKILENVENGNKYKLVNDKLHTFSKDGEPEYPINKNFVMEGKNNVN